MLDVSSDSHRKVNLLNILITPNGMFDDMTKKIVEELDNVWLFAEDYGKLYIFENQPTDLTHSMMLSIKKRWWITADPSTI